MSKIKSLLFTTLVTITFISCFTRLQATDNFKLKNISNFHDISAIITNPYDKNDINNLGTIGFGGEEYSGSITSDHPFYLTVFSGSNPIGRMYEIAVNPKKTKTIFLEWDSTAKTLRPQEPGKKKIFFGNKNVKKSEIISESEIKAKTIPEVLNYFKD